MKLDLDQYNEDIKEAGHELLGEIKNKAGALGIVHRDDSPSKGSSVAAMKDKYKLSDGAVSVISIKVRRSLIISSQGAGKGKGGSKGSNWLDKYNVRKSTNPASLGKMATGGRKEKPFISEVLNSESGVDKIAAIAAERLGDAIVSNMLVKVK